MLCSSSQSCAALAFSDSPSRCCRFKAAPAFAEPIKPPRQRLRTLSSSSTTTTFQPAGHPRLVTFAVYRRWEWRSWGFRVARIFVAKQPRLCANASSPFPSIGRFGLVGLNKRGFEAFFYSLLTVIPVAGSAVSLTAELMLVYRAVFDTGLEPSMARHPLDFQSLVVSL
ncbi:hypothetical protein C8R47DRAFT_1083072 [Mycena vitilis]|nr:hypothetical protein C8R47DRAFT_1083072 [Mycena vitilis]